MKLTNKNKVLLQSLGIVFTIAITAITMKNPDLINYPYSVNALQDKKGQVEQLNSDIKRQDSEILQRIEINKQLQEDIVPLRTKSNTLKTQIRGTNFELDLPSVLMTTEGFADKHNLDITFIYNDIAQFIGGSDVSPPDDIDQDEEEEELDESDLEEMIELAEEFMLARPLSRKGLFTWAVNQEYSEEAADYLLENINVNYEDNALQHAEIMLSADSYSDQELYEELIYAGYTNDQSKNALDSLDGFASDKINEIKSLDEPLRNVGEAGEGIGNGIQGIDNDFNNISEDDKHKVNMAHIVDNVPNIEGFMITTIPVVVEGSYSNVRAFLADMDAVDFIESNIIDVFSYGEYVTGKVIYNVFHTQEEGGGIY